MKDHRTNNDGNMNCGFNDNVIEDRLSDIQTPQYQAASMNITAADAPLEKSRNETEARSMGSLSSGSSPTSATRSSIGSRSISVSSSPQYASTVVNRDCGDFFLASSVTSKTGIEYETWPLKRLYCRDDEIEKMKEIYELVVESQKSHVLLIRGESGAGKTTMGRYLKQYHYQKHQQQQPNRPLCYLEGQFDPLERPEPYRAFVAAVSEYLQSLNEEDRLKIRKNIDSAITDQAGIDSLTHTIPELRNIYESKTNYSDAYEKECMSTQTTRTDDQAIVDFTIQNWFKHSFCKLLQSLYLATKSGSDNNSVMLIFLDDMQWTSELDLVLLFNLIADVSNPATLYVLSCSCTNTGFHETFLQKIHDKIDVISLNDLNEANVSVMLGELLESNIEKASSLSKSILMRTNGNLCFIVEYLRYLINHEFLRYDHGGKTGWSWDLNEIETSEHVECRTLEDLVLWKFGELSDQARKDLKILSCLGVSHDIEIIRFLTSENMLSGLDELLQQGWLILDDSLGCRRFIHTKIRDVIYDSMEGEERQRYHYQIGRKLWREVDMDRLVQLISLVVGHLLVACVLMNDPNERTAVAKLCLSAGERAAKQSAFQSARFYFVHGVDLVGGRGWCDEYSLLLSLTSGAAECSFSSGFVDDVFRYQHEIVQNARCYQDTIRVRIMHMQALGCAGKMPEARDTGIEILRRLGEKLPRIPSLFYILVEVVKLKNKLHRRKLWCKGAEAKILDLPLMKDAIQLTAMQVLNLIFLYSAATSCEWTVVFCIRMMNITLDHGISSLSCLGMAYFSEAICCLGHVDDGLRFAEVSLALFNKFQNRNFLSRFYCMYYGEVYIRNHPPQDCIEPLWYAHQVGLETGDNEFAMLCAVEAIFMQFELMPLPELEQRLQALSQQMESLKQEALLFYMKPFLQTIQNLMGRGAGDAGTFSGPIFFDDQVNMFKDVIPTAYDFCCYFKALLQYVLGDSEETLKLIKELQCVNQRLQFDSVVMVSLLLLLEGVCVISLARASNCRRVSRAKHCSNYLKRLAMREPYSHLGKHMLLEAELAGLKRGHDIGLLPKYVLAISAAKESGSLFMYALANELTAKYLLRQKLNTKAERYILDAIRSYNQWGATAKAAHLRNEMNIFGNVTF